MEQSLYRWTHWHIVSTTSIYVPSLERFSKPNGFLWLCLRHVTLLIVVARTIYAWPVHPKSNTLDGWSLLGQFEWNLGWKAPRDNLRLDFQWGISHVTFHLAGGTEYMRCCFIPSIGIRPAFLFAEGFSPLFVLEISRFSQTNSSRPLFAMCLKRTP